MQLTHQLAVFLENRPGAFARMCATLGKEKINIFAISTSDTVDHLVVRMVVTDHVRAQRVFEEHGTLAIANEVLMLDSANKPGALAALAERLAEADIKIEYLYSATNPENRKGLLILRPSDPKKALKVINASKKRRPGLPGAKADGD